MKAKAEKKAKAAGDSNVLVAEALQKNFPKDAARILEVMQKANRSGGFATRLEGLTKALEALKGGK